MFQSAYSDVVNAGCNKTNLLKKNPWGYLMASVIAGMFIAFGSFVCMTIGGIMIADNAATAKLISSLSFASALSLVVMAGSELFTGNNFVMACASFAKKVSWFDTIKLWIICFFGNLIGSWIAVILYHMTGLTKNSDVVSYFATVSAAKLSLSPLEMITRGILCNILVCLAVWCSIKMQSEAAKLIMILWCIFLFMMCGFEHSIANMSIIGVGLLHPLTADATISVNYYITDLFFVTLGNMIGGIVFVALPYYWISAKD
ncbi:formate/nitrite transporter family protein [Ruminococcus gauvreauii]|uniref:Formate/nitrite transporter family protein n=1 Tax=Ruminococcus gauvreauii TaxID=438033 RepID=A0ABY5VJU2_9FIRM|nr:formate/nitrite transporter family protein [Ruminococcus gauvreauii]UWP60323.1 formate/nitrite transporter family protein [Ruminococcus gauvreauii]